MKRKKRCRTNHKLTPQILMLPFQDFIRSTKSNRRYCCFEAWKQSNVIAQKQAGYVAIGIKVLLGDFYTDKASFSRINQKLWSQ
jgi:hypothetical protein